MDDNKIYDVAVLGGGVVGCATLFCLTKSGYRCILLEKNPHLVAEASAGNSGMLHTGFDAPLGSLELHCIQRSQKQFFDLLETLNLPYNRTGATMVAWDQTQLSKLPLTIHHSQQAKVKDVRQLTLSELYQREPNLSRNAAGAVHIPDESIVDPWLTPVVLAEHARDCGGQIITNTLVNNLDYNPTTSFWKISTNRGQIKSRIVINCCGLYGDIVDKIAGYSDFVIKPRKGQYLVFDKTAKDLISSSILPVPTEITKGVIVFRSVYDNVIIGPTAEETSDRRPSPQIDPIITMRLQDVGKSVVPPLLKHNVVRMYTGVRPATEYKDYQIISRVDRNWLTVGGIRSTGLSASIGIGEHVVSLVTDKYGLEPTGTCWNTLHQVDYKFTNRGTAIFRNGVEHCITHPLTVTGIYKHFIGQSSL